MAETGNRTSPEFPPIGKVSSDFFQTVIFPRLGSARQDVLVGPKHGVDCGVIKIGDGNVMVVTTDPIFIVPEYGWERSAWFAWHILASDVTTSGFPPAYVAFDFNLPMNITEEQFGILWEVFHRESSKYGASVVTGHTARYTGTDYPMVGGATFMAVGPEERYLHPGMAGPGDAVIMTKGAAIEATGIFACTFAETIKARLGEDVLQGGQALFYEMSTVEDALAAVRVGVRDAGVTAMHDATECGVTGGLFEIAQASGTGIVAEQDKIPVLPATRAICGHFGMDPMTAISEGTLLICVKPEKVPQLFAALGAKEIKAAVIGTIVPKDQGLWMVTEGKRQRLEHPGIDPFWQAMKHAMEQVAEPAGPQQ